MVLGKFKRLTSSELFRGSLILFILINLGSVINYVYHFFMARMLGPADYGILAVLTSIIYILSVPTVSVRTVVSKKTTEFKVKNEFGKIKGLLNHLTKELTLVSLFIFIIFGFASIFLSKYLGVPFWLLILTGSFIFVALWYSVGQGILQGMKKFNAWGGNFILSSFIKLVVAIILVVLGFGVYGALLGFIFGAFIAFIFIFPAIKEVTNSKEIKNKEGIFAKNNSITLLTMLFVVLIYTLDTILAKGFFSPEIAGGYAVVSLTGKIILFSAMSISNAMFPISSERYLEGNKEKTKSLMKKTFGSIIILCSSALILFALFPEFIIKLLFGLKYLMYSNLLIYVGVAFSFISLFYAFVLYKISINDFKKSHNWFLFLFLVLQIVLLALFHGTIKLFSIVFMISTAITFFGSLLLLRKWK